MRKGDGIADASFVDTLELTRGEELVGELSQLKIRSDEAMCNCAVLYGISIRSTLAEGQHLQSLRAILGLPNIVQDGSTVWRAKPARWLGSLLSREEAIAVADATADQRGTDALQNPPNILRSNSKVHCQITVTHLIGMMHVSGCSIARRTALGSLVLASKDEVNTCANEVICPSPAMNERSDDALSCENSRGAN